MDLNVYFSTQIQEIFSHYCFTCAFFPFLFFFSFWNFHNVNISFYCLIIPICFLHSFKFLFLFAPLNYFKCSVKQFAIFFFCMVKSTVVTLLNFLCIFVFFNPKISVLFFDGHHFLVELLLLLMHCFPNFIYLSISVSCTVMRHIIS